MEFFFDASAVKIEDYGKPIDRVPDGEYLAMIFDSVIIDHKNGDKSLKFTLGICQGEYSNSCFEMWIALRANSNPKKVAFGQKQLAKLIMALGKEKIRDTQELHNKPFGVVLETKNNFQGVKKIFSVEGAESIHEQKQASDMSVEEYY